MFGPLFALYCRTVREHTRHRMTPWSLATIVAVIWAMMAMYRLAAEYSSAPGRVFFGMLVSVNVFFIALASLSSFCSVITEEKEEGTLGLLRMTNLNPVSILLGKSTSRLTGALLLLIAQFPFTLLSVTLGGISLLQIYASYAVLISSTFFLCNLALLSSVICRTTRKAVSLTMFIGFVLYAIIPAVVGVLAVAGMVRGSVLGDGGVLIKALAFVTAANPISALFDQIQPSSYAGPIFGTSFWTHLIGGLVLFGLSVLSFDRFCGEAADATPRALKSRENKSKDGIVRRLKRPGKYAMAWKDFHFVFGGKKGIIVRFLVYCLFIGGFTALQGTSSKVTSKEFSWSLLFWAALIAAFEIISVASAMFAKERQWQTLSSIVTLPVSLGRIFWEKILGALPVLIGPLLLVGISALVNLEPVFSICRGLEEVVFEELSGNDFFYAVTGVLYAVLQGVFFLVLILNLSLRVKRAAVGIAVGVMFVFNFVATMLMGVLDFDMGSWGLTTVILGVAVAVAFMQIFTLIPKVAAEN